MAARGRVIARHVIASATAASAAEESKGEDVVSKEAVLAAGRGCPGYEEILECNWHGSVRFNGTPMMPASLAELQDVVCHAPAPVRVVGRGHSFTPVAECAGGTLISLGKLNQVLDFKEPVGGAMGSITVQGGATYVEIAAFLGRRGALRNLPSAPHFTVAGAIGTGTHGSGIHIQNLAADVSAIEFVRADGSLIHYSRAKSPDLLEGCRVHLGCLGVVSKLTLDVQPFYTVQTHYYEEVELEPVLEALPDLWTKCDSVSVYTRGFCKGPEEGTTRVMFRHFQPHWRPEVQTPPHSRPPSISGRLVEDHIPRYYSDLSSPEPVMWQPSGQKPWIDGLTLTCDGGKETDMVMRDVQAEFFVALSYAAQAVQAVRDIAKHWSCGDLDGLLLMMEFREVKGDDAWMSPHPGDSFCIHFSFNGKHEWLSRVMKAISDLEGALWHLSPRAHWGKLAARCFSPSRVRLLYGDGLLRFRALCRQHDPKGKFLNAHVRHMLFAD